MKQKIDKSRYPFLLLCLFCALAAMTAAFLVRTPSADLPGVTDPVRQIHMDDNGMPYLTELDSYYHVRLVDQYLETGSLGDTVNEDGEPWDSRSFYPEGRTARYTPGIVWTTAAVYRASHGIFGTDLYTVEFYMGALMSILAALAAFAFGLRTAGPFGGLSCGILVGCSSVFVARTTAGWFDTDMFVILMDVLLILFLTEALKAETLRGRILASALFALSGFLFMLCWTPTHAMVFALLTLGGGFLYVLWSVFLSPGGSIRKSEKAADGFLRRLSQRPPVQSFVLSAGLLIIAILISQGISFFPEFFHEITQATDLKGSEDLPNVLAAVTELKTPALGPEGFLHWFATYFHGGGMTVINGAGGLLTVLLALAALGRMVPGMLRDVGSKTQDGQNPGILAAPKHDALYFCVLGAWLAGGFYIAFDGIRFIEHLAVPTGLLAGLFIGWLFPLISVKSLKKQLRNIIVSLLLCGICVTPTLLGAVTVSSDTCPEVSDASRNAMDWIRDNAKDPDAPIISWWDRGYYYEARSGHPASWDGGTLDGKRAVLIGRALITNDMELSWRLMRMIAWSGNRSVDRLCKHLEAKDAYEAIWNTAKLDRIGAAKFLRDEYKLDPSVAKACAELIVPGEEQKDQDVYLVITDSMMDLLGWIEYFGGWDFSGDTPIPDTTTYKRMPGTLLPMDSDDPLALDFFTRRSQEVIWSLCFYQFGDRYFIQEFEDNDGMERIQVWRVPGEPLQ